MQYSLNPMCQQILSTYSAISEQPDSDMDQNTDNIICMYFTYLVNTG